MVRLLYITLLSICLWVPSNACLNDSEIQSYEDEFESEYMHNKINVQQSIPDGVAITHTSSLATVAISSVSIVGLIVILLLGFRIDLRGVYKV